MRILLSCVVFLAACSSNPVTGKNELAILSESQEITIGEQYYGYMQQAQGGPYVADPTVERYVQKVGYKLAAVSDRPHLPYEFVVLDNSIPNAWALPGGKIAIYRGLLVELKSEAELAAVLAHEIVHSAARHGAKAAERQSLMEMGMSGLGQVLEGHQYEDILMGTAQMGGGLVHMKYSRSAELEADKYGIKYMVAAGYDPQAAVELQKTFVRLSEEHKSDWLSGLFSTHPPSEERVIANEKTAAEYPKGGFIGEKEYAREMEHLMKVRPAYDDLDRGYLALVERNNPREALRLANQGIEIEPREAHLYNLAGKAEVKLGHTSAALSHFEKAVELNPQYFDFYLQLGLLEQRLGHETRARAHLQKSMELLPTEEASAALGQIGLKQGRAEPEKFDNFLDIDGRWNSTKNLVLTIQNKSKISLYELVVEVNLYDSLKKRILSRKVSIPDVIEAGGSSVFTTSIVKPKDAVWMETTIRQAKIYD